MDFNKELSQGQDGWSDASELLSLFQLIKEHLSPDSAVKDRIDRITSFLFDQVNALFLDEELLSDLKPLVQRLLMDARGDDIEVIIKDESLVTLTNDVDEFVLKYRSDKFVTLKELIFRFMREKELDKPSDIWKSVGLGRRAFHKLLNLYNERESQAPRLALLQLSVGLRLSLDETSELLGHQFYRLTRSESDLLFVYFAMRRNRKKEKDTFACARREIITIREKLEPLGIILPEIYE